MMDAQGNLIETSTISGYYLQGDGDLFKAPQPVIEEPGIGIDPVTAAIFCGENGISPQSLIELDIESSIESTGTLLNEVFYECQKDLLAKEGDEKHLSEGLSIMISTVKTDESSNTDEKGLEDSSFQKSISSNCLSSLENLQEALLKPSFPDSHVMDEALYGIRRSFSEGDLKTSGDGNTNLGKSPLGQPTSMISSPSEDRKEKLSRYRSKKSRRNFGRKIKYACRKALADSQPRIRGRFAKIE